MEINISFDEPMIPENLIMSLTEDDISSFYVAASDGSDKSTFILCCLRPISSSWKSKT